MNRRGQQSLIRRPYSYAGDVATLEKVGLEGVLIPVWTTKAFTATWNAELPQMPFKADLVYHEGEKVKLVTGKLSSNLDVDLEDCWLIYRDWAYPLDRPLQGKKAAELEINLSSVNLARKDFHAWADLPDQGDFERRAASDNGLYNPTGTMKKILFYENADPSNVLHNQLLRHLDYSWRFQKEDGKYGGLREVVLYARVRYRSGQIDSLCEDAGNPLPTHIWLGNLPGTNQAKRPPLSGGTMNQDTYIRVLLPVRPAGS